MPSINFAEVRRLVSLIDVLGLLSITYTRRGNQLRATCPLCDKANAWSGSTHKNKWHCWSCEASGDAIDLYKKVGNKNSDYEAAVEMCEMLRVPLPHYGHR